MNPNLKWKALVILIVLGLCLYGLFFMPKFPPKNLADLKNNFRERIRLGLDRRGGSHLILQVQVDDAVNIHTDQTMDRMREEMRNRNLTYNEVRKLDLTHIQVLGIPPDQSSAFKDMVGDRFAEYADQVRRRGGVENPGQTPRCGRPAPRKEHHPETRHAGNPAGARAEPV